MSARVVQARTTCDWCGAAFAPTRHWQRFCPGSSCARDYHTDEKRRAMRALRGAQARAAERPATRPAAPAPRPGTARDAVRALRRHAGMTTGELAHALNVDAHSLGKRLADLAARRRATRGERRECTVTGRLAVTWHGCLDNPAPLTRHDQARRELLVWLDGNLRLHRGRSRDAYLVHAIDVEWRRVRRALARLRGGRP